MFFSLLLIGVGLGVIAWFLIRLLFYEGYWNTEQRVNLPDAGQIGDFIGGLSGTLFTLVGVVLLFETLALQRDELAESRKVFEKQQFDNTFFNLLNVYQEVVKSLHFDSLGINIGKAFFEEKRKKFYEEFAAVDKYTNNRRNAKIKYIEFYTSTKEQTANYFRTIYRIFKFISKSDISPKEKTEYTKILRAQLSESELFFLYYNSFTEYGAKFRTLINDFDILKHLPILDKVEFKEYAGQLEQIQKNSVGLVLEDLKNMIRNSLDSQKLQHKSYLKGAISINVDSSSLSEFKVTLIKRDNHQFTQTYQQGFGLNNFDIVKTGSFFYSFILDLLLYSNYLEFNRGIHVESAISSKLDRVTHMVIIKANNSNSKSIKFH
jgi:hypothetical protein